MLVKLFELFLTIIIREMKSVSSLKCPIHKKKKAGIILMYHLIYSLLQVFYDFLVNFFHLSEKISLFVWSIVNILLPIIIADLAKKHYNNHRYEVKTTWIDSVYSFFMAAAFLYTFISFSFTKPPLFAFIVEFIVAIFFIGNLIIKSQYRIKETLLLCVDCWLIGYGIMIIFTLIVGIMYSFLSSF